MQVRNKEKLQEYTEVHAYTNAHTYTYAYTDAHTYNNVSLEQIFILIKLPF